MIEAFSESTEEEDALAAENVRIIASSRDWTFFHLNFIYLCWLHWQFTLHYACNNNKRVNKGF
jgi:hypothetical protein